MTSSNVSSLLQRIIALENQTDREIGSVSQSGGGGGTFDSMGERLGKLEVRVDGVERRLESIDGKLDRIDGSLRDVAIAVARLPTREFLVGAVLAGLAVALAIAALTFNVADYASKAALQAEQTKPAVPAAAAPPIIINVPPSSPSVAPVPQPAPTAAPPQARP